MTTKEAEKVVKCKVLAKALAIDITPGIIVKYGEGDVFECPEGRAKGLMNSVKILKSD